MKLGVILLVYMSLLFACDTKSDEIIIRSPGPTPGPNNNSLSYLALGDSYTIGQSVTENERWPVLFARSMSSLGVNVAGPDIIAKTGWTTANLLSNLGKADITKTYDLVSLCIGVNNQYQGLGLESFRIEFKKLLQKSIVYAGNKTNHVFVLSIPDWGATPVGLHGREQTSKEIDMYNKVAQEECDKEKILFIDITTVSRKALDDLALVASDGLHYSGVMHQLWANEAISKVRPQL